MSVSFFSLALYPVVLIIAVYIILYKVNLRTSHFVLHSRAKDAFVEREGLAWVIGTVIFAVSWVVRFLLEEMSSMTGTLNVLSLGAIGFALCIWIWVIVRLF